MSAKPFPIPVMAWGPGSQPEDTELAYLPLPREIESFDMPHLPSSEQVAHLAEAKAAIASLIARLQNYQGGLLDYPVVELDALDYDNRQLINQLLGEGEVSARVQCLDGRLLDIQESVFAGIWRVLESDADGQLLADRIEACRFKAECQATGAPQSCPAMTAVSSPRASSKPTMSPTRCSIVYWSIASGAEVCPYPRMSGATA